MTGHIYCTDYGDVRVSEREASILRTADDIRSMSTTRNDSAYQRFLDKADSLREACERVARFKAGISTVEAN